MLDLLSVACVALKAQWQMRKMQEAKDLLLQVVQELYEQNSYRVPAAKRVKDATGLSLSEAKDLLEECKPMLKKARVSDSKPVAPPQEVEGDTQLDEETTTPEKSPDTKNEKLEMEVKGQE